MSKSPDRGFIRNGGKNDVSGLLARLRDAERQAAQVTAMMVAVIARHGGYLTLTRAELERVPNPPLFHMRSDGEHGIVHLALDVGTLQGAPVDLPPAPPAPPPPAEPDKKPRSRIVISPDGEARELTSE